MRSFKIVQLSNNDTPMCWNWPVRFSPFRWLRCTGLRGSQLGGATEDLDGRVKPGHDGAGSAGGVPADAVGSAFVAFHEQRRQIPPAVKNAVDHDLGGGDVKGDDDAAAIGRGPQARAQIVTTRATLGEGRQVAARRHDAIGIVACPFGTGSGGDIVIEFEQIRQRLGSKDDLTRHAPPALSARHRARRAPP